MAQDPNNKRSSGNQHVGTIIGKNKHGVPMVAHNFHGQVYVEPINKIEKAFKYNAEEVIDPKKRGDVFTQTMGKVRGVVKEKFGFKEGGVLDSLVFDKQHLAQGGQLDSIGGDSVEVRANNPAATDSVELPEAFVDNDEIISKLEDGTKYVFPDDTINPLTGNKFSKDAKKLAQADAKIEDKSPFDKEAQMAKKHNAAQRNMYASTNEMMKMIDEGMKGLAKGGKYGYAKGGKMGYQVGGMYQGPGDPPRDTIPSTSTAPPPRGQYSFLEGMNSLPGQVAGAYTAADN